MHVRGAITSVFAKKGFKISLDTRTVGNSKRQNYISMLGMRQDDDWILYAAYNDQEKIRNVFASNLWYESCSKNNNFGINNGSQYEYVELFLNNEYWGLYALGHRIDRKQLNLDDDEFTFKKTQYDEAEINLLTNKKLDITNYKLVYNSGDEKEDWKALTDYYNTLLTSQNIEELYNISDINNLIDYYLFQEVIQANDNAREMYLKNIFITMKNYKGRKVVLYTPWDYDQCMGNIYGVDGKNFTLPYYVEVDEKIDFKLNAIGALQKLGDTKINELIKNRYNDLRKTYWSEKHLEEVIDEYSKEIYDSGAFNRDKNRWHDGSFNEETEKLTKFKEYVLERLKCTDEFINSI